MPGYRVSHVGFRAHAVVVLRPLGMTAIEEESLDSEGVFLEGGEKRQLEITKPQNGTRYYLKLTASLHLKNRWFGILFCLLGFRLFSGANCCWFQGG